MNFSCLILWHPPTLAIAEVDEGYPRSSTLAPSSTSGIPRVGGRGEGAGVDKGAQVHKGAKVHEGNPRLSTLAPKWTSSAAPEAAKVGKIYLAKAPENIKY